MLFAYANVYANANANANADADAKAKAKAQAKASADAWPTWPHADRRRKQHRLFFLAVRSISATRN